MDTENCVQRFDRETVPLTVTEWGPGSEARTWGRFAEPRGWAMKWCGFALSCARHEKVEDAPTVKEHCR